MKLLNTLSLTLNVSAWLANTRHPRILHVFDQACNLINERKEIVSIVTPEIGNGPFNLVVETDFFFNKHLSLESPITNSANQLNLGNSTIKIRDTKLWNPRPDWKILYARKEDVVKQVSQLPITNYLPSMPKFSTPLISVLSAAISAADISTAKHVASQLAGLGQGLTPAGDDFILGAILATWIIHPFEIAKALAEETTNIAAPLTTSLSAAWLRSVARGEAGILWHEFFEALTTGDNLQSPIAKLLAVGETSGADALAGFTSIFISFAKAEAKSCHS